MNIRSIEYAVSVYRLGSIQAAAEHCHASTGTVSMQITRIEEYLGVKLFSSRRYPAEVTAQGRIVLRQMENLVSGYRDMLAITRRSRQPSSSGRTKMSTD